MNNKKNRKGFTIVELAIVIAIIAILTVALIPTFGGIIEKAKNTKLERALYNEYTEYVINQGDAASEEIYIFYEDMYYHVENGAINIENCTENLPDDNDKPVWDSENGIVPTTP